MFSFINKGQDDLALFFINHHPSTISNNYLLFNNYNSQLKIIPEYDQGKITLTFHNIQSVLNQSYKEELETHMNYIVSLY